LKKQPKKHHHFINPFAAAFVLSPNHSTTKQWCSTRADTVLQSIS